MSFPKLLGDLGLEKKLISNNAKCRKQIMNFIWNTWKYFLNQTEIVPVFAQFFETFSYFFLSSHRKLFPVLLKATMYLFFMARVTSSI